MGSSMIQDKISKRVSRSCIKYYKVIENYLGMRIYGRWYLQFFETEIET